MKLINWIFGFVVLAIGLVNTFWGNDPVFGICIVLASFIYFPPTVGRLEKISGFKIPVWVKIIVGLLILWASLGVGELFTKIEMMRMELG